MLVPYQVLKCHQWLVTFKNKGQIAAKRPGPTVLLAVHGALSSGSSPVLACERREEPRCALQVREK